MSLGLILFCPIKQRVSHNHPNTFCCRCMIIVITMTPEHMTMLRSEKTIMLGEELNPVRKASEIFLRCISEVWKCMEMIWSRCIMNEVV